MAKGTLYRYKTERYVREKLGNKRGVLPTELCLLKADRGEKS